MIRHYEAILACDPVAFDDFGGRHDQFLDGIQCPWQGVHSNDRLERISQRSRVDRHREARDLSLLL